jgi:hypothetical protein
LGRWHSKNNFHGLVISKSVNISEYYNSASCVKKKEKAEESSRIGWEALCISALSQSPFVTDHFLAVISLQSGLH